MKSTSKPFKSDARVSFKAGYRPVSCELPPVMTVFISSARATVVLIDGKAHTLATVALEVVK